MIAGGWSDGGNGKITARKARACASWRVGDKGTLGHGLSPVGDHDWSKPQGRGAKIETGAGEGGGETRASL